MSRRKMRATAVAASVGLAVACGGCTMGPDYVRPK